ncbi:MAG: NAD(P)/FAD-dependent oxidoreductase [Verrucomicrobia bacterium]|nr:NAD(P)/FAD-dependent oxidoreductase [Verrucomicrobiota bacterium]
MTVIVGGGAAGFFAAINLAEAAPGESVILLEKTRNPLAKVRISGGGRCNTTHACFDPRELSTRYPRGGKALIGPLTRFGPRETIAWFEARGVRLKTESDGRMFPTTDSSQTIIDCLLRSAEKAGVRILEFTGLDSAKRRAGGGFTLKLSNSTTLECDHLVWAAGGCKAGPHPAAALGHTVVPPVPSLFTFHIESPWLRALSGLSVPDAAASIPGTPLKERGPILITHTGLSGPCILRLSAWGARTLHEKSYRFPLRIDWFPGQTPHQIQQSLQALRETHGARTLLRTAWNPLPARLWESLLAQAGIPADARWSTLSREQSQSLARTLSGTEFEVSGKSMNKEEFVTSGGIPLPEVDLKTMQSRIAPGLYFAGEALDIDGITGGYNFQAAWTTAWHVARSIASTTR